MYLYRGKTNIEERKRFLSITVGACNHDTTAESHLCARARARRALTLAVRKTREEENNNHARERKRETNNGCVPGLCGRRGDARQVRDSVIVVPVCGARSPVHSSESVRPRSGKEAAQMERIIRRIPRSGGRVSGRQGPLSSLSLIHVASRVRTHALAGRAYDRFVISPRDHDACSYA